MKIPILIALPLLAVAAAATAQFAAPAEDRAAVTVDDSGVLTAPTAAELLGANPALTGDTEWDTTAKINAATTDDDFVTLAEEQTITGAKTFTSPVTVDGTGVTAEAFLLQPTGDIVFTEETGDFITILRAKEPTNAANVLELPDRSGTLLTDDDAAAWTYDLIPSGGNRNLGNVANRWDTVWSTNLYGSFAQLNRLEMIGDTETIAWDGTPDDFETVLGAVDPTADNTLLLPDRSGTLLTEDAGLEWDGFGARAGLRADGTDHGLIVRGSDTGGNAVIGWSVSGASAVKAVQEDHASSPAVNVYREVDLITTASDAAAYNVFQSGRAPVFSAQGGYGNPDYAVYANQEDGYRVDLDGETVDRGRVGFAAADATTESGLAWTTQSFADEWDDTHDAWDGTTFTAPYAGMYRVSAVWTGDDFFDGDQLTISVLVDGTTTHLAKTHFSADGPGSATASGSAVIRMEAGDTATLRAYSSAVKDPLPGSGNYQTFSVYLQN